jgi:HD-GYP domain-containing protein (c-di-GMP phosphodiesterase class II)
MELAATLESQETAADTRPLYNSRIISTFLKFIKRNYSYVNTSELLAHAMMEPYQVEDETHWFTQEQVDSFYERLVKLTNNRNIAREAGRYAASPETSGLVRQYVLGFVGPARVYEMIGKATANFVRSSAYEARKLGTNRVEINVVPIEGVQEKPYQCENRTGYFEAVATVFNYKLPRIEHTECMFKGGKTCRYLISWQELRSAFWKKIRNVSTVAVTAICFLVYAFLPAVPLLAALLPSFFIVLALMVRASEMERAELSAAIDNLRLSTESLMEQSNTNYNNALLINEIGLALSRQTDVEGILRHVVQVLEKRLDYDRGMILLASKDRAVLRFEAGFGYQEEQRRAMRQTNFHLDKPDSKGIFVVAFRDQKPFLINNIDDIMDDLSPRSFEFARKMGSKSFICCPIMYVDESIGILAVDNLKTKRPLLQSDINLLMGIAPEIAISLHNANLIEERELQFQSILQVLASTIDARDPLTAGHSENVTEYAVAICNELGLSREYREMIRVASLLHDYGKIGISDDVLKKKGLLTKEEREEIKTHSVKSMRILDKINFAGVYKQVPEIVGCHHEKYDGTGYPRGLRGEEIPLGARILAVADVFEAITAKRHYRNPMPVEEAIRILLTERGRHFDARIVDAFLTYFMRERAAERLKV